MIKRYVTIKANLIDSVTNTINNQIEIDLSDYNIDSILSVDLMINNIIVQRNLTFDIMKKKLFVICSYLKSNGNIDMVDLINKFASCGEFNICYYSLMEDRNEKINTLIK